MNNSRRSVVRLLRTARGQIEGTLRMLEEDRYCIEVVDQILAARAMLGKAGREMLRGHLEGCVREAFASQDAAEQDAKMAELMAVLEKMQ